MPWHEYVYALLALCVGNPLITDGFQHKRLVMQSFESVFVVGLDESQQYNYTVFPSLKTVHHHPATCTPPRSTQTTSQWPGMYPRTTVGNPSLPTRSNAATPTRTRGSSWARRTPVLSPSRRENWRKATSITSGWLLGTRSMRAIPARPMNRSRLNCLSVCINMHCETKISMKSESCHDASFFVDGGTTCCLWHHPWRQTWHDDDSLFSVIVQWASYQIRKIVGCACAGNIGNVFPHRRLQRKPLVNDPGMHQGTCVTHVPWCMSGSLTRGGGENVPGIPGACAPAILRIW